MLQLHGCVETTTDWGQCDAESASAYVAAFTKSVDSLSDTVKTLRSGLTLRRPDARHESVALGYVSNRLSVGGRGPVELPQDTLRHYLEILRDWCSTIERY